MADFLKLTKKEIETFINDNQYGILSMAGEKPYALPMGYMYRRKTFLIGMTATGSMVVEGRKMKYLERSKNICFTICRPRWFVEKLKNPCTTLVIEGTLEEIENRSYYGLKEIPKKVDLKLYKIKIAKMGARKCNRKPCEIMAGKSKAKKTAMKKNK
jgi:hypothetical protein